MTPQSLNLPGDIILIGAVLVLCVPPVLLMRSAYLQARKALLGRKR